MDGILLEEVKYLLFSSFSIEEKHSVEFHQLQCLQNSETENAEHSRVDSLWVHPAVFEIQRDATKICLNYLNALIVEKRVRRL